MKQPFESANFKVEITEDGSPTLRFNGSGESMHHFAGAAAETWYVYGQVMYRAAQVAASARFASLRVCSVGLGLGYIEMAWALIKTNFPIPWIFDSFEKDIFLRRIFINWIKQSEMSNDCTEIYDQAFNVLKKIAIKQQGIESESLQELMAADYQMGVLNFHSELQSAAEGDRWNIICFDAFSKKTELDLWEPRFLDYFLKVKTHSDCIFTTYAATSSLKEMLLKNNFQLIPRLGFSGKRECTLAVRGHFKTAAEIFRTF